MWYIGADWRNERRKLLMALSIAATFTVATSYPHMGDAIILTAALPVVYLCTLRYILSSVRK